MSVITSAYRAGHQGRAGWRIAFEYDEELIASVKLAIPASQRSYDPDTHRWWFAVEYEDALAHVLPGFGGVPAPGATAVMPNAHLTYPPHWRELVAAVRERSAGRCEATMPDGTRCNAPNGELILRPFKNRERWEPWSPYSFELDSDELGGHVVKVVLTTAHTCRDSTCDDLDHLAHWCQLHHLRYDAAQHAGNAAETRRRKRMERGQGALL